MHNRLEGAKFFLNFSTCPGPSRFEGQHFCFRVSDGAFDAILGRIHTRRIPYRGHPRGENDRQIDLRLRGRNLYGDGADGHLWEILTVSYARPEARPA